MEAPDNIYVPQHNIEAESIYDLCEFVVGGSVEYIRKDALLEWAKARKVGLSSGESFVAGERKMLKEIIDKLNSM